MTIPDLLTLLAGSKAPVQLSAAAREWVADKRSELTAIVWHGAGIVRSRTEMKAALQQASHVYLEAKVCAASWCLNVEVCIMTICTPTLCWGGGCFHRPASMCAGAKGGAGSLRGQVRGRCYL